MSGVPILVEGSSVRALVVGGGAVASRKAAALSAAGAAVRVVALVADAAMRALADAGTVSLDERAYESSDIGDAMLVVAATDDRAVNARVATDARLACRLANVADDPESGSYASMATHRAGPLVIGVGAGGVPAAAARIRDALASRFDGRYAAALEHLASTRRDLLERGEGDRWHAGSRDLIDERFCDAVEQGTIDARVAAWR